AVRPRDFDGYLIADEVGIATKETECLLVKAVDPSAPGPELESDARVLDIKTRPDGSRHRHFTEAARQVTTTEWPEWPILGPRTAPWCLEFLARQDQHPRARQTKWVHECRLEATDEGVGDHDLAMRMAELGLSFDQLNLGELASFELSMRKAQMAEWRHRDRLAAVEGDDLMEESYLYLGTGETRGLAMAAPALVDHINQEMHRGAQILKERRKAKEERLLSRGGGGGGSAGSGGSKAELHKKIQQQAADLKKLQDKGAGGPAGLSRSVRSRARRRLHVANWIADAAESFNALHGHGGARDHFSASAGKQRSLEFTQSIIEQAGPPPCSPAAAHAELRGHQPGYDTEPELPAQYQREIPPLPGPGARCDPSDVLRGLEHDQRAGIYMDLPEARFGSPLLQVLPMVVVGCAPARLNLACTSTTCASSAATATDAWPTGAVVGKLEDVGLKCKGVMEPEDLQTFTGITFERRSGRVGASAAQTWRGRLALLFVADRRSATGDEIFSLLGHFTWAALLRRTLLCMFQQAYVFARVAGRRRLRPWSRVELELRRAAALLVFAFSDSKKPNSTFAYASDASRGQAGSGGGYGAVGQTWANELVEHTAASAESWRYSVLDAIGARECALGFDPAEGTKVGRHPARAGSTSFEGVGRAAIGDFSDWGVLFHGEFQRDEDITVLEGRAAAMAARHAVRGRSGHGHRHLILVDNLGLALAVLAVGKGRSPSITLNHVLQQLCAMPIVTDITFILRWTPLEWNPADKPSRLRLHRTRDARADPRHAAYLGGADGPSGHQALRRDVHALARRRHCRGGPTSEPQSAGPSSPGAAGLGGALHAATSEGRERARAEGLTVLQSLKVGSAWRVYFQKEYLDFVSWTRSRGLSTLGVQAIDSCFAQYLDFLLWEGHNHHKGGKALAALKHYNPGLGLSSAAALERTTAGLRGFRKLARGSTWAPMARELLFAAVGLALHRGWRSFAIALALSWDTMIRLPSELVAMTRATLVAPAPRSGRAAWSLLLFPEELNKVSKTLGCGEGVVLSDEVSTALGPELAMLVRARTDRQPLWDFDTTAFNSKFRTVFDQLGHQDCHLHQVRHGGASFRAAVMGEKLADIQAMLRHQSDNSTKRHARHVRYFAEVGKLSPEVTQFGREVDANLTDLLRGRAMTDAAVRRHWRAALREALADLFSGTGKVASWLERKSGYAVLRIDVAAHPAVDLSRRVRGAIVIGWLRARVVR
ncbi:unnamed protein product, partial [Prorocentrum cordatum]